MQKITGAKPVRDANFALKALSVMRSLGAIPSEGSILTVRIVSDALAAVEPALRQVSYARCAQGNTGDCDHFRLHAAACKFLL